MARDVAKRKITLENYKGEVFNLLLAGSTTHFLHKPDGFGFQLDLDIARLVNEDIITNYSYTFPEITGEMIFKKYTEYDAFVNYIMTSQKMDEITYDNKKALKLYYNTTNEDANVYFYVVIKQLDKSEKSEDGLLRCPISFQRLSHKKKDIVISKSGGVSGADLNTFPLPTYDSTHIKFNTATFNSGVFRFFIKNTSNIDFPVKLTLKGTYNSPSWINKLAGLEGRYFVNETNGELVIDSNNPQSIINNGINVVDSIDHTKYNNFLFLVPGINIITVKPEPGTATGDCQVILSYTEERIS